MGRGGNLDKNSFFFLLPSVCNISPPSQRSRAFGRGNIRKKRHKKKKNLSSPYLLFCYAEEDFFSVYPYGITKIVFFFSIFPPCCLFHHYYYNNGAGKYSKKNT
jgi:hypothetical protein